MIKKGGVGAMSCFVLFWCCGFGGFGRVFLCDIFDKLLLPLLVADGWGLWADILMYIPPTFTPFLSSLESKGIKTGLITLV